MKSTKYLIVGGGMTAAAAIKGIREIDSHGTIALIGEESDPPYARPPLSKALWKGKALDTIWRDVPNAGVELVLGRRVASVDPGRLCAIDAAGTEYGCERLLLATGGTPRRLPHVDADVLYYRTLRDYRRLREQAAHRRHFAVIGGGFIGSEIAAALAGAGRRVTMIFPEAGIGARVFPPDLSDFLNHYYEDQGVAVLPGVAVADVRAANGGFLIRLEDGRTLAADGVVAGLGLEPNVALAASAGVKTDNGFVVDEYLETARRHVYAAGDAANFYNPLLGVRLRVEHEDNANAMGAAAGRCMAGARTPYHYLPYFYSDLFDLGYEALGETDPRHQVVAHWNTPYREGVLFYLRAGRVRGLVFWNVWNGMAAGRDLLAQPGPFDARALKQWMRTALPAR